MRLSLIEASRALAALVVVLLHASHLMRVEPFSGHVALGGIFNWGYVGVDFFFVLSGFIITYVHHRELGGGTSRWTGYLWKRFVRVFPIYWSVLLATLILSVGSRLLTHRQPLLEMGIADMPGTLLLIIGQGEPAYVGVAWSLQYEVMFYISFCVLLLHRRIGLGCYGLWAVLLLLDMAGVLPEHPGSWSLSILSPHCLQFLMGIATAFAALRWTARPHKIWLGVGALLFVAATVLERSDLTAPHGALGRVALGLASAVLLFVMVGLERHGAMKAPHLLSQLGNVSYSIYLAHNTLINITLMVLAKTGLYHQLPEVLVFAIAVTAAVAGGWWIGQKVELPLVRWLRHRFVGSRQSPDALAAP